MYLNKISKNFKMNKLGDTSWKGFLIDYSITYYVCDMIPDNPLLEIHNFG